MSSEGDPSITYEDVVAMWDRLAKKEPEPYRYLVNRATLHRMMVNASADERAALEMMRERKILIVIDYLPEGTIYRLDATLIPKDFPI